MTENNTSLTQGLASYHEHRSFFSKLAKTPHELLEELHADLWNAHETNAPHAMELAEKIKLVQRHIAAVEAGIKIPAQDVAMTGYLQVVDNAHAKLAGTEALFSDFSKILDQILMLSPVAQVWACNTLRFQLDEFTESRPYITHSKEKYSHVKS